MGLYDTVLVVDDIPHLSCARGHALRSFQTKDIDEPSMSTYLVHHDRLYRTEMADAWSSDETEPANWRFEDDVAVHERRYALTEVPGPLAIHIYCSCTACDPILVRTAEPGLYGDLISEHALFVDFRLIFCPDQPLAIERTSGTRDDFKRDRQPRHVRTRRRRAPRHGAPRNPASPPARAWQGVAARHSLSLPGPSRDRDTWPASPPSLAP